MLPPERWDDAAALLDPAQLSRHKNAATIVGRGTGKEDRKGARGRGGEGPGWGGRSGGEKEEDKEGEVGVGGGEHVEVRG